jgi:hypothetical protein
MRIGNTEVKVRVTGGMLISGAFERPGGKRI